METFFKLCRLIQQYCNEQKIKGLLVGVNARKAFDSVDHEYLLIVLEAYGFGPQFISWVKLLEKNLKADIPVNGYRTEKIDIEQSVKQGDALYLLTISGGYCSVSIYSKVWASRKGAQGRSFLYCCTRSIFSI